MHPFCRTSRSHIEKMAHFAALLIYGRKLIRIRKKASTVTANSASASGPLPRSDARCRTGGRRAGASGSREHGASAALVPVAAVTPGPPGARCPPRPVPGGRRGSPGGRLPEGDARPGILRIGERRDLEQGCADKKRKCLVERVINQVGLVPAHLVLGRNWLPPAHTSRRGHAAPSRPARSSPESTTGECGEDVRGSIVEGTMTDPAEASPAEGEEPLHRALGLTDDEFAAVVKILGRPPNHLELALYAVMWSEHCSYKSSRLHLRRLPTEGAAGAGRPGRERRGHRRRRRHRRGHPHREPQPPLGHRALPGGGDRGRRDPARHLHHGGPAPGRDGPPASSALPTRPASAG